MHKQILIHEKGDFLLAFGTAAGYFGAMLHPAG
jgi:hypothetical protein